MCMEEALLQKYACPYNFRVIVSSIFRRWNTDIPQSILKNVREDIYEHKILRICEIG